MIEVLPNFPDSVIGLRCTDHMTRQDYEAVLIPTLNAAFKAHKTLRAYCEIASFSGMSPSALWDDVKVGMEHLAHWERIAIVTDIDWIGHTTKLFAFLFPGEVRVFSLSDAETARKWIVSSDVPTS
ncbi:MAG: STAS/SEC14 domain-containing protein [Ktedonobacterales bacterium]